MKKIKLFFRYFIFWKYGDNYQKTFLGIKPKENNIINITH